MKKFVKVFIIVLSILAVIGGTVFFFFKKVEEKNNKTGSIVAMLESEIKLQYDFDLAQINDIVDSDATDNRMDLLIQTNAKLDEIIYILATYYIDSNTELDNEKIANKVQQVNDLRKTLMRMMEEYNLKKDSEFFNKHEGVNDLYKKSCEYLIQYANLANLINNSLEHVERDADLKFNMFEIYSNIIINSFNKTKLDGDKLVIDSNANIDLVNSVFHIENSFIVTSVNQFSSIVNLFNESYNKCDKLSFANNLNKNIQTLQTANPRTVEEIATFYFKEIFGI